MVQRKKYEILLKEITKKGSSKQTKPNTSPIFINLKKKYRVLLEMLLGFVFFIRKYEEEKNIFEKIRTFTNKW